MVADQFRDGRRQYPVDAGLRIATAQLGQHRQGVNNIAYCRGFDDQNALELSAAEHGLRGNPEIRNPAHPVHNPYSIRAQRIVWEFELSHSSFFRMSHATGYADRRNNPIVFFIHADTRWRNTSRRSTPAVVTQLN